MLTIADMLELRAEYEAKAKEFLLKASVLTDLISLAEEKVEIAEEKEAVNLNAPDLSYGTTDESY